MVRKIAGWVGILTGPAGAVFMLSGCNGRLDPDVYLNAFLLALGNTLTFLLDNLVVGLR